MEDKVNAILKRVQKYRESKAKNGLPEASNQDYTDDESPMSSKMPSDMDWIGPHIISGTGNGPVLESESDR